MVAFPRAENCIAGICLTCFRKVHMCVLQVTNTGTSATLAALAVSTVIQGRIYNSKVDYSSCQVRESCPFHLSPLCYFVTEKLKPRRLISAR